MSAYSHTAPILSMRILMLSGLALVASVVSDVQAAKPASYLGRWTLDEETPQLSVRGRPYQTVDIVTCGAGLCGISVTAKRSCGETLFRLANNKRESRFIGNGKWGNSKKNIVIYDEQSEGEKGIQIMLGDGYDLGSRSENMPKYDGDYKRIGAAKCSIK